jgi:hypothetical protein
MTRNDEPREIVRYLEDGDPERGFPCVVSHEHAGGDCKRPAVMAVYGLTFCEEHGEECAAGAFEELHQDAYEFFERLAGPHVPPLGNPLVRAVLRGWGRAIPADELDHEGDTEERLRRAFPLRAELADAESTGLLADPIRGNRHPVDYWRDARHDTHAVMRVAYERGMTWLVERREAERESIAAQCAYATALAAGEHPEVLERAHRENLESSRKVAERLGK